MQKQALLTLADGTSFQGFSTSEDGFSVGEVIFNTAQTGYQEILTDPSYAQQIIVFTNPHIGNVGVNIDDQESSKIHACGMVTRSLSPISSNWRAEEHLSTWLTKHKTPSIAGINTRALTLHLRKTGSQAGCIMVGNVDPQIAKNHAVNFAGISNENLSEKVSTKNSYEINPDHAQHHVVVYDFGVKQSIIQSLLNQQCKITVVPGHTSVESVLALDPNGIVFSNGPGDPTKCIEAIENAKILFTKNIPLLGICLGHQILALAQGAQIEKMTFGHHGANHPIRCLKSGDIFISSQNHGFVVSEKNFPHSLEITHQSLFDQTIAGFSHKTLPIIAFQGHPESSPGPTELKIVFEQFKKLISTTR
ncbi:MAG: glutamine-hydrolyzing carbamoyl-phosphate synthase small subunit [Gammaproteobacteria bacterium]